MIAFIGKSHAAQHLSQAARDKGLEVGSPEEADVIFISEDTPTDSAGQRDLVLIHDLVMISRQFNKPLVLTSQVPPRFTRSLGLSWIYHQSETLRIIDAAERAANPEQFIVGCWDMNSPLPPHYSEYLEAFKCPVLIMSFEDAEFAKIAINVTLAAQVDNTNRLAAAAAKVGADWSMVAEVLRNDSRIGRSSYLRPGCWQESPHLLRDSVTLREIEWGVL